jgi:hypothetical protein
MGRYRLDGLEERSNVEAADVARISILKKNGPPTHSPRPVS